MYRSGTSKFLSSLTPLEIFTDENLSTFRERNYYIYKYKFYKIESDFISNDLGIPPICYSNYDNIVLKRRLCDSYVRMLDIPIGVDKGTMTLNKNITIRNLLEKYNNPTPPFFNYKYTIDGTTFQNSLGICLYKVNLNDFKITKYKYIHTMGLLYDILNSYENCNYFIKIIDSNQIIYTFVDKLIINSFISLLYEYVECHDFTDHYVVNSIVLIMLYHLFSYSILHEEFLFSKITNNFEIIRDEFKNKRTISSLQINLKKTIRYLMYYQIKTSYNYHPDDNLLKWFISNNNFSNFLPMKKSKKFFRINNYGDVNIILQDLDIYWSRMYKEFIIYEKDISYYVYRWIYLLIVYIHYIQRNKFETTSLNTYLSQLNINTLINSLKNYEKSKYFYTKDDFNNKILNSGISF